jgi:ABC-2 type transport system permease protein
MQFNILDFGYANIDGLFILAPFVFLFLIPAITMRSFADERKSGTIELLMTQPLTDLQVILAKYFAGVVLVIFSLDSNNNLCHFCLSSWASDLEILIWGECGVHIWACCFLGSTFVAIGIFASSLSDNQIVSFIIAVFFCGFFYIGFELFYTFILSGKDRSCNSIDWD